MNKYGIHKTRFVRKMIFCPIRYSHLPFSLTFTMQACAQTARNHSITVLPRRERGIYKPRELDTLRSDRQKCKSSLPTPRDNWPRRVSTQAFLTKVGLLLNSIQLKALLWACLRCVSPFDAISPAVLERHVAAELWNCWTPLRRESLQGWWQDEFFSFY